MLKIQTSVTAGTDRFAEFTRFPAAGNCSNCGAFFMEFPVGVPHRGRTVPDTATALLVRRRPTAMNPKRARTIATLCRGCALIIGYAAA